uniref:Invertebrate defensins family profile domain-containing protein n=1 Tax=Stomoxys calcitrans TaxID=35570 RepID=A0A1I8Q9Y2_STOCA
MKFFSLFPVILVVVACLTMRANAAPSAGNEVDHHPDYVDGVEALRQLEPELHGRYKRATCDLLSMWNVNHSACAAHCLLLGKSGGRCNDDAVCVCRK